MVPGRDLGFFFFGEFRGREKEINGSEKLSDSTDLRSAKYPSFPYDLLRWLCGVQAYTNTKISTWKDAIVYLHNYRYFPGAQHVGNTRVKKYRGQDIWISVATRLIIR
jgi:hypothetical protein